MTGVDASWRVRHRAVTGSTNKDALGGMPGDVFTADLQTAGRGRLDHRWLSPPGENLMMSAVIDVTGAPPEEVATLPLVVGLAVSKAVESLISRRCQKGGGAAACAVRIKWPNDVLIDGRKVSGILCERNGDRVIAGVGVNVNQMVFDPEIADRATSLRVVCGPMPIGAVRDAVLERLADALAQWRAGGFRAVWPEIAARDFLKGTPIAVRRTDDDASPVAGLCGGIRRDGALEVGGEPVFAGEAHICIRQECS